MDYIYNENIEEYNPNKKCETIIAFDDMIADMLSNKKLNSIVTELFIRGRKLNVFLLLFLLHNLICCVKKYQTKFYALFDDKNFKQMSTSTNCIKSFIRY